MNPLARRLALTVIPSDAPRGISDISNIRDPWITRKRVPMYLVMTLCAAVAAV